MSPADKAKEAERKRLQRAAASPSAKAREAERKRQQRVTASPGRKAREAERKRQQRAAASAAAKAREAERKRQQRLSSQPGPSTDYSNTLSTPSGNNTPRQHSAPRILHTAATNYSQKHFVQNPVWCCVFSV
ncbi:hypothetical protein MTO96_010980 [Rhipicephalus appendiculatus]